jgi:hypothetical protein
MGRTTHFDSEVIVALQGTLDTFALPDVLRLLAATKKSGRLKITGPRGAGSIWVTSGGVSAIEVTHAPHATEAVDGLFELLRFEEGTFAFEGDVAHDQAGPPADVELLLEQAEALLREWREIESVVPSLDAYVTLRRTLDAPSVSIAQQQWPALVAVGGGATVRRIGDELCLPEIPVSRAVRDLAELGIVEIAAGEPARPVVEPVVAAAPAPVAEPVADRRVDDDLAEPATPAAPEPDDAPAAAADDFQDFWLREGGDDAAASDAESLPPARPLRARRSKTKAPVEEGPTEPERFVPLELPGHMAPPPRAEASESDDEPTDPAVDDLAAAFPGLANRVAAPTPEDEELARQLATLSPRAAEAVRAAAEAATDEERDAALDEAEQSEEGPINRGLLLKFLSSVKG